MNDSTVLDFNKYIHSHVAVSDARAVRKISRQGLCLGLRFALTDCERQIALGY